MKKSAKFPWNLERASKEEHNYILMPFYKSHISLKEDPIVMYQYTVDHETTTKTIAIYLTH